MLSIRKITWASSPTGRLSSVSPVTPAQETSPYTVISRVVSPARDSRAPWPGSSPSTYQMLVENRAVLVSGS